MNCPKCKKIISPQAKKCPKCGTRIVRKSDKMARSMTLNSRFAMACGGLFVLMAILLVIYSGDILWAGILLGLGVVMIFIGKKMV